MRVAAPAHRPHRLADGLLAPIARRLPPLGGPLLAWVATLMLVLAAAPVAAQDLAETSRQRIETMGEQAITILGDPAMGEDGRSQAFAALFDDFFAVSTIAQFAAGRTWNAMSEAERDEYLQLFRHAIIRTYQQRLERYDGQTMEVSRATLAEGGQDAVVDSVIRDPRGAGPVQVQWRLRQVGGQPKVLDVIVEGVSMLITTREDFQSVIDRGGGTPEALLVELRGKAG